MAHFAGSIDVDLPRSRVYALFSDFERWPDLVDGVEEVRWTDPRHLRWRLRLAGREMEGTAEVTEQRTDERITLTSVSGMRATGTVTFDAVGDQRTRVGLRLEYRPGGILGGLGTLLGGPLIDGQIRAGLQRFKELAEASGGPGQEA